MNMMMMKIMTTKKMKVGMTPQKKNLAFRLMGVMNLKLIQIQLQSMKKTWIPQTTGKYYLLAMTSSNDFDSLHQNELYSTSMKG